MKISDSEKARLRKFTDLIRAQLPGADLKRGEYADSITVSRGLRRREAIIVSRASGSWFSGWPSLTLHVKHESFMAAARNLASSYEETTGSTMDIVVDF